MRLRLMSAGLLTGAEWIGKRVDVFGPGPAGGLPPTYGGGSSPTVNPADPTPGLADLTERAMAAYAYSRNVFMRDSGAKDPRDLLHVTDIAIPDVGASYVPGHTAPVMQPFPVMEDDRVRVSAILVPHGPVFPSYAVSTPSRPPITTSTVLSPLRRAKRGVV